jgi:hypothetical protein
VIDRKVKEEAPDHSDALTEALHLPAQRGMYLVPQAVVVVRVWMRVMSPPSLPVRVSKGQELSQELCFSLFGCFHNGGWPLALAGGLRLKDAVHLDLRFHLLCKSLQPGLELRRRLRIFDHELQPGPLARLVVDDPVPRGLVLLLLLLARCAPFTGFFERLDQDFASDFDDIRVRCSQYLALNDGRPCLLPAVGAKSATQHGGAGRLRDNFRSTSSPCLYLLTVSTSRR